MSWQVAERHALTAAPPFNTAARLQSGVQPLHPPHLGLPQVDAALHGQVVPAKQPGARRHGTHRPNPAHTVEQGGGSLWEVRRGHGLAKPRPVFALLAACQTRCTTEHARATRKHTSRSSLT